MKDWRKIAEQIVDHHTVQPTNDGVPDRKVAVYRLNLIGAIKDALEAAADPELTVGYGPAPGKPVLVNDLWLEHLNNKLAQIQQRMNELDGRTRQVEDVQRGMGDIVTATATRADEHRRLIDDVDKRLEGLLRNMPISFLDGDAGNWYRDILDRLAAVEQSAFASRNYISRLEAGAKEEDKS